MIQLALTLSRRTDPATSKAAAGRATGFRSHHEGAIYGAIFDAGARGATMHEIAAATGLEPVQVGRRLGAMGRRGVIKRNGEQRRGCCVWIVSQ